jgi:hypothetical protein
MILLDTNVLCEPWRPAPNAAVIAWLDEQVAETLYVSSITVAEVCFGVACLPKGKRRNALSAALEGTLEVFGSRVIPFDATAARHYGELAAKARAAGEGFPLPDGYIAAIAAAHGFSVATRDTAPFEAAGMPVINPFARGS